MKITLNTSNNNNKTSFQSRNKEIRFADEVMRRVGQEFPMISPARLYDTFSKKPITPNQKEFLCNISDRFKYLRISIPDANAKPNEYTKKLVEVVKNNQMGNCGEAGTLAKVGLAINGIKGVKVGVYGYSNPKMATNLDYTLILVNLAKNADLSNYKTFGKKSYVVNQWGGAVGYVSEVFGKIKSEFAKDRRMRFINTFGVKIRDFDINEQTLKEIEEQHPSLKIKHKNTNI